MEENTTEPTIADTDHWAMKEAIRFLVEGKHRKAVRSLRAQSAAAPYDLALRAELACALAYDGAFTEASSIVEALEADPVGPEAATWIAASRALMASKVGDLQDARRYLQGAIALGQDNPLIDLMLGRLLMLVDNDPAQAEGHFRALLARYPRSETATVHLVSALFEANRRTEATRAALNNARAHPTSLRSILLAFYALLVASPLRGGLLVVMLVILTFVPYFGLLILATWLALAIASNLTLRRVWPRMAMYPLVVVVTVVLAYGARSIVWGRLFP